MNNKINKEEIISKDNYDLAQYIIDNADKLKDKVIELPNMKELSDYKPHCLYHKYIDNVFTVGYELISPNDKVRMTVNCLHDRYGRIDKVKVEKVEKLINYQRQLYYDLKPRSYGFLIPPQDGDLTAIDYIKNNKLPSNTSILVRHKELKTKFTKVDRNMYVPNNNPNAYLNVISYISPDGYDKHILKQVVEKLCIPTVIYDSSKLSNDMDIVVLNKSNIETINLP